MQPAECYSQFRIRLLLCLWATGDGGYVERYERRLALIWAQEWPKQKATRGVPTVYGF